MLQFMELQRVPRDWVTNNKNIVSVISFSCISDLIFMISFLLIFSFVFLLSLVALGVSLGSLFEIFLASLVRFYCYKLPSLNLVCSVP